MKRSITVLLYVLLFGGIVFCGVKFRAGLNEPPVTNDPSTNQPAGVPAAKSATPSRHIGQVMTYGAVGFACLVALGLIASRHITAFLAQRMEQFIFDEDLEGERDPEYDEAEEVWKNGRPLEAIQLMRDYLKQNPHKQYAALRIAEIYEKDLGNFIAATLEYEEILKKKLPSERWGWAAIHLSNLYSGRLNKPEQATALLRRIISEHPSTAAARKARERLGEPAPEAGLPPEPEAASEQSNAPRINLPPGFRPKE